MQVESKTSGKYSIKKKAKSRSLKLEAHRLKAVCSSHNIIRYPIMGNTVISVTDMETGESADMDINLVRSVLEKYGFTKEELSRIK